MGRGTNRYMHGKCDKRLWKYSNPFWIMTKYLGDSLSTLSIFIRICKVQTSFTNEGYAYINFSLSNG